METERPRRCGKGWWVGALLFSVFAVAAYHTLDARVVHWLHDHGVDAASKKWVWVRKLRFIWPGHFLCTMIIAAIVAIVHRTHLRSAVTLVLAGLITGLNSLIKWEAGRHRLNWKTGEADLAFHPFEG